jgi:hypothetical protein
VTDVFISYATQDRDRARTLASALESQGWSVWWDRNIVAGQSFDITIERALESAKCVIVLWSNQSIQSEWVKNEAAAAAERGVLVPALLDEIRIPLEFRRKQTANLARWKGDPKHEGFKDLCDGVAANVAQAGRTNIPSRPTQKPQAFTKRRALLYSVPLVMLLLIGAGMYLGKDQANGTSAATPGSFPLTCRGGGVMAASVVGEQVRIPFQPAAGRAGDALSAGQCTWSDRILRPGEPHALCDSQRNAKTYLPKLERSDSLLVFHVYNDNAGCMRIVKLDP